MSRGFALVETWVLLTALASLVTEHVPWGRRLQYFWLQVSTAQAQNLCPAGSVAPGVWSLSRLGTSPVSSALAGGLTNPSSRGVQFLVFFEKFPLPFLTTHAIFRSVIIFYLYFKNDSFIIDF